jgi:hypothetical protein
MIYYAIITLSVSDKVKSRPDAFYGTLKGNEYWENIYENDFTLWSAKVEANNTSEAKGILETSLKNVLNCLESKSEVKYAVQISSEEHFVGSLRK